MSYIKQNALREHGIIYYARLTAIDQYVEVSMKRVSTIFDGFYNVQGRVAEPGVTRWNKALRMTPLDQTVVSGQSP